MSVPAVTWDLEHLLPLNFLALTTNSDSFEESQKQPASPQINGLGSHQHLCLCLQSSILSCSSSQFPLQGTSLTGRHQALPTGNVSSI